MKAVEQGSDPNAAIELSLSMAERQEICRLPIRDEALCTQIRNSDTAIPHVQFSVGQLNDLSTFVAYEATRTSSPRKQRRLDAICSRISLAIDRAQAASQWADAPGLAEFLLPSDFDKAKMDLFAELLAPDLAARFDPQIALDRRQLQARKIDWLKRVAIWLTGWRRGLVLGLAGLDPSIRQRIAQGAPTRRRFWLSVWDIHRLREAVAEAGQAADEPTKTRLGQLGMMLFAIEMEHTADQGPGYKAMKAGEFLAAAMVRRRAQQTARSAKNASCGPKDTAPDTGPICTTAHP